MRGFRLLILALATALPSPGQFVGFECNRSGTWFPHVSGTPDEEGVVAEAFYGGLAMVFSYPVIGLPVQGGKYAVLEAGILVDRPFGVVVPRPLYPGTTELRVPVPAGSTCVSFAWAWHNEEGYYADPNNDGFDFSVCDAAGARLFQCAWGDTSVYGFGPTALQTFAASMPPTPPGAYLSCAVFDGGGFGSGFNVLAVDDVRFAHDVVGFECGPTGPFPPFGDFGDCEEATAGPNPVVVERTGSPACGFPVRGDRFAALTAYGIVDHPPLANIVRPVAASVTELRLRIPAGATTVSFAYGFENREGGATFYNDGFDVSVCDAAGALLQLCAFGDTYSHSSPWCNGPFRYFGTMAPAPAGAYLSCVVYNGWDNAVCSRLFVDDVWFASKPRVSFSSPLGAGSLALLVEHGAPGDVFFLPSTLFAGRYPDGPFFGLDPTLAELLMQIAAGAPFVGMYDGNGRYAFGPTMLVPEFSVYTRPIDSLGSPVPRLGDLKAYVIP